MATLYISNWSGYATPRAHGPGRKWTIMALPRRWEKGEGVVSLFVPDPDDVRAVQDGRITPEEYRATFLHRVALRIRRKENPLGIVPGQLMATTPLDPLRVADGDTLLCACSVAKARAHQCHRVWAGAFLALSGCDVVLDTSPLAIDAAQDILQTGLRLPR